MPIDELPLGLVEAITNGIGVIGVILIVGFMIATGRLVTRREVDRLTDDHARQLDDIGHDRDEWRAAHRLSEQGRLEERENTRDLIEGFGTTLTGFLEGFRRAAQEAAEQRREGSSS